MEVLKIKLFKRIIFLLLIFSILAVLVFLGVNLYVRASASKYILSKEQASQLENIDCIIVLGAHVKGDGSPSLMLQSRLDSALGLYASGISDTVLMSGDHGRNEYDEVNNMMDYALENSDIPRDRVFLDHAGFSTYETACRAKEVFCIERGVFVTQRYHLYRTVYNARYKGIEAYGVAADDYDWPGMPYYKLRESLAIFKDFFGCLFGFAPTYLGDEIPVSGSARATHDIPYSDGLE